MNNILRKLAIVIGLFLLSVSVFWSQDGFNFDLAGDSVGTDASLVVGWGLAVSVSVIQFVFSTNYRELNASLIVFGVLAYVYSIYTNYQGILHFQGVLANKVGAAILGIVMDGVPEPLIAWGLHESLSGDFVGNLVKVLFGTKPENQQNHSTHKQNGGNQKLRHPQHNRPQQSATQSRPFQPFHSVGTADDGDNGEDEERLEKLKKAYTALNSKSKHTL